jgi:hypothetical protein
MVRRLVIMMVLMWLVKDCQSSLPSPTFHLSPTSQDSVRHDWNACKEICKILSGKGNYLKPRKDIYKYYVQCVVRCVMYETLKWTW